MNSDNWNEPTWLFAPDTEVVDNFFEIGVVIDADYQESRAMRLFQTIEYRLAKCIAHFDDFSGDRRLVISVQSELNFLRAVWGEIRHARGICPPASSFLRMLQNAVDRDDWSNFIQLHNVAVAHAATAPSGPLLNEEEFPAQEWWLSLPTAASAMPPQWRPYDLGDVILELGLQELRVVDIESFKSNLQVLSTRLAAIQEDIQVSGERLETVEEEVGARIRDALHATRDQQP